MSQVGGKPPSSLDRFALWWLVVVLMVNYNRRALLFVAQLEKHKTFLKHLTNVEVRDKQSIKYCFTACPPPTWNTNTPTTETRQ